jgi:hypothetical protein
MRNLTLLLAVLALYGLMLIFGANVLAASTYDNAAVVSCGDDAVQSANNTSHTVWCDKDEDGDDASRTVWCDKDEDGDDASRTVWCDKDNDGDDASRTVWCDKDENDGGESSRILN